MYNIQNQHGENLECLLLYDLQKPHGENLEFPCTTYRNNMVRISNVHVQHTETTW